MKIDDNEILILDVSNTSQEDWSELKPLLIKLKIRWKWLENFETK